MDYLPIQASSVPCERMFSLSTKTDTKQRNCINPLMMEALQMLKFHLKQKCLSFTEGWAMLESLMTDDKMEEDLLANLLNKDFR